MKLKGKQIDDWFLALNNTRGFPNAYDYRVFYNNVASELNTWVHPYVNSGAMMNDSGYLTDHGPMHIRMIFSRITSFLDDGINNGITPFECLVLLLSAHIHDVGNILGRNGHQFNCLDIIHRLGDGAANQHRILWDYVYNIANAHSGSVIDRLNITDPYLGHEIRSQYLASILKFADELAEDCTRADRYNTITGNISDNSPISELYHQYALGLVSLIPDIKTRTIKYLFIIDEETAKKTFPKKDLMGNTNNTFILDEIYVRTLKAHYERLYCMRFMRPQTNFDLIKVTIRIKLTNGKIFDNSYDLIENGLDDPCLSEIFRICPTLKDFTGEKVYERLLSNTLC